MVVDKVVSTAIYVLIHIAHFNIESLVKPVSESNISPVLVENLTIYRRFIAKVDK